MNSVAFIDIIQHLLHQAKRMTGNKKLNCFPSKCLRPKVYKKELLAICKKTDDLI